MKIIFVVKYLEKYQNYFLAKNPDVANISYNEMRKRLYADFYGIFNSFVFYLQKNGHEAELIIPNFELLQKKWASENGLATNANWEIEITEKQLEKSKPEILFLSSNFDYYGAVLKKFKPHCKKVCAWISCPFDKTTDFSNIDHIFTLFEPHFNYFNSQHIASTLTQAGFDPQILEQLKTKKDIDVSFIGGIGAYHKNRTQFLKQISTAVSLKIWGYGFTSDNPVKNILKKIKNRVDFKKSLQGEIWGLDMYQVLANSKITLNSHGDIAKGHSVNMRMFEATGVGTLLITDYSEDLNQFFIPDKEVVCYKNEAEAIEKIEYYLKHENERKQIALAGQKRTLEHYSYEKIIQQYISVFQSLIKE